MPSSPFDASATPVDPNSFSDPETLRLAEDARRDKNWKRWGPYLSERQWGTVREDYSPGGSCWDYLSHDHARSRAYRWGEDGLMGFCDRQCRMAFAVALWNGKDPILKERLFGLTGNEANHGEDVKELYYYLDSTPTHTYCKALYKYPQAAFPYGLLVDENRRRSKQEREFELLDTGVFKENRYFDVFVEYAKPDPEDIYIRITVANRGPDEAVCHLLPTLWFRNSWSWPDPYDKLTKRPELKATGKGSIAADHEGMGKYTFDLEPKAELKTLLFTENETNQQRVFGTANTAAFVKDAFHEAVVAGRAEAVNPSNTGTKAAGWYELKLKPGQEVTVQVRLRQDGVGKATVFGKAFDAVVNAAKAEADAFYEIKLPPKASVEDKMISRQAFAGMLWSKQFYYYVVGQWLDGDKNMPPPPAQRHSGRNADWRHLFNRDILSMPDKWEYPWYAAWDLAFHMVTIARVDPDFAKDQLMLLLREWYMHPNGQIPAYEFAFGDVNPPVHAWAAWRIYKETGKADRGFLERVFQKLLLNFTWWVNRKDVSGKHVFAGGFLGLDNIGVFDRSKPLPNGGQLTQADGTAWMAFYSLHMLSMALELALENPAYEDIASKFFEHFVAITDAMNTLGGTGLWDEKEGFYYDQLMVNGQHFPMKVRSMVGLLPLIAVSVLDDAVIDRLPDFKKRMQWFLKNQPGLARHVSRTHVDAPGEGKYLLAIASLTRMTRTLHYMLDEGEFLSGFGLRSLSKWHDANPYVLQAGGQEYSVRYEPADSQSSVFGGNSNWRGPIWFPVNILILQAVERYFHFFGDGLVVSHPSNTGSVKNLHQVTMDVAQRLISLFRRDAKGNRPCHDGNEKYANDPHFKDLILFYEYFDGDTGRGVGASHQTGWTGLVANLIEQVYSDFEAAIVVDPGIPAPALEPAEDPAEPARKKAAGKPKTAHGVSVGSTLKK